MSIFKRLSTTITAHIDQMVGEIENHDALVKATLKDLNKKVAEANVRLGRVKNEATQLQAQITRLTADTERWRQRAIETAETDEQKALECVNRARHCEQQVTQLRNTHQQYQQTIDKLTRDVATAEQRVRDLKQQHSLMRARQSTASVVTAMQDTDNDDIAMLNDTFERWEVKLRQAETLLDSQPGIDPLEAEYVKQEEADDLKRELASLLEKNNRGDE